MQKLLQLNPLVVTKCSLQGVISIREQAAFASKCTCELKCAVLQLLSHGSALPTRWLAATGTRGTCRPGRHHRRPPAPVPRLRPSGGGIARRPPRSHSGRSTCDRSCAARAYATARSTRARRCRSSAWKKRTRAASSSTPSANATCRRAEAEMRVNHARGGISEG